MRRHHVALRRGWCALACVMLACSLDNQVGQDGEYTFLPRVDVIDTAPRRLRHLLIVEEDAAAGAALVYFFTGELAAADLGLTDLRRIASLHGRARIDFPLARESYLVDDLQARLDADEASRGPMLRLRTAGTTHRLWQLDSAALAPTGAGRFLRTVDSRDFGVRAFFGHFELEAPLSTLSLEIDDARLAFELALDDAALALEREHDLLRLAHGGLSGADYVIVELLQPIRARSEGAREEDAGAQVDPPRVLEALVRTTLAPDAAYEAGEALLTDAAARGCWSQTHPLTARLSQVARSYHARRGGDFAVVHHRIDALQVEVDRWTDLVRNPAPPAYCEGFEPASR